MNKWLFHQNGITITSLSATVTRVSNFVEENVCVCVVFLHRQGSRPGGFSHSLPKHNRLNITLSEIKRDFPMEFPFFDSKT